MKRFLVLLTLCAAPQLAFAQTPNAPVAAKAPMPKAQELFDNLFAPYAAAKTFRGNIDILVQGEQNAISEIHLKTVYRFNDKGDLERQLVNMRLVERTNPKQSPTLLFAYNTGKPVIAVLDQKVWWTLKSPEPDTVPVLHSFLKPTLDGLTQALNQTPNFVPVISKGVEAGRPVFILKAKGTNVLRVVVDAQTRALRSFELKDSVSILASDQAFDEPMADAKFEWTPPADFKQVAEGEVALPAYFNATIDKKTTETAPAN